MIANQTYVKTIKLNDAYDTVWKALNALGIRTGELELEASFNTSTVKVLLDDEYFGIFDFERLTFVD